MNIFKKIFGKKENKKEFTQEEWDTDYELKMTSKIKGTLNEIEP